MRMALQQTQPSRDSHFQETNVIPLHSQQEHLPPSFGALLVRMRGKKEKADVTDAIPVAFERYGIAPLTPDMYRKLESGIRAPQFEELRPLYDALRVGCGIIFSPEERQAFVNLARIKIKTMQRRRPMLRAQSEWDQLLNDLVQLDQDLSEGPEVQTGILPGTLTLAGEAMASFVPDDVRHLVGREKWLEEMLSYLQAEVPKKIIIVQALTGMGKTSALNLLFRHLLDTESYHVIFFPFATAATMTAVEHLDRLLARVLSELEVLPEGKMLAREQQVEMVLTGLAASDQPTILLLDDVHLVLGKDGRLPDAWQQFLVEFVRREHKAAIYLATRERVLLPGRVKTSVAETELAALSPQDGVKVWQRLGFVDVPHPLLEQATARLGGNAWYVELCARNLQRRRFTHFWQNNGRSTSHLAQKSEHQFQIEQLLAEKRALDLKTDREARLALEQVISKRLSHTALHLLELLAVSPVALPFALLEQVGSQAEEAFDELLHASLVDRDAMLYADRARLLTFVTEAAVQNLLAEGRLAEVEQQVTHIYSAWLSNGFHDEQEKAAMVTELAVLLLQQRRLLDAAQLLVRHGWLCFALGNGPRLARLAQEVLASFSWRQEGSEQVCGGLLLYHYLGQYLGRKNDAHMRAEDYQAVSELARAANIVLQPATQMQLLHHKVLYLLQQSRFAEVQELLGQAMDQMEAHQYTLPAVYASLLGDSGMLWGLWADHAKEMKESEAERLRRERAIAMYQQGIELLRMTGGDEAFGGEPAFSVEHGEMSFRLARLLNDMAHQLVCSGQSETAISALRQSIDLKRQGRALPGSLAASLGELAQASAGLGSFREALASSVAALDDILALAATGNTIARGEVPVYQIDHARLLIRQLRLDEAESLLQQALDSGIREVRREYRVYAKEAQHEIAQYRASASHFGRIYLDWRWYPRYREAIAYDAFNWLSHAGPFTWEEQGEWDRLAEHSEREAMMGLIRKSLDREIESASREQREPRLRYPAIPIDDVTQRIQALTQLKREIEDCEPRDRAIEEYEPNAVVRRLYSDAIEEQTNWLHLIASCYSGDNQAFWNYNQRLFAPPTEEEMQIALHHLKALLHQGLQYQKTHAISTQLIGYLQQWRLYRSQNWLEHTDSETEGRHGPEKPRLSTLSTTHVDQRRVSSATVKKFFEAILREYQFDWDVLIDQAANNLRIENNINTIILPQGSMSVARVRELLSHEIECHVFRSEAGKRSKLGLLSLGTQGYLYTEEGLALYHDNKTAQLQAQRFEVGEASPAVWIGTLAVGLASGVLTPAHTFSELLLFFDLLYLLTRLLTADNREELTIAQKSAHRMAINRCLRTYRGVPDLASEESRGVCYTKDVVYLTGFRQISRAIEEDSTIHERLMIGVIAKDQLPHLAELGMELPATRPQWLAHRADLDEYILSFQ